MIYSGNRTVWSPIRSATVRVIDKSRVQYDYRLNCMTQSSVTNLLIITITKFVIFWAFLKIETQEILRIVFASSEI